MGCCEAAPEKSMDNRLMDQLRRDQHKSSRIDKLLFLGAGGSGKSTFFKQLKCIHGKGFSITDRKIFKEHIATQIIEQMIRAIDSISIVNETLSSQFEPLILSDKGMISAEYIQETPPYETLIDEEIASNIKTLWSEEAIKTVYTNRSVLKIEDSSAYFFNNIDRIGQIATYLPNDKDILLVRYRTTGVVESQFHIKLSADSDKTSRFHIFDVGGQKSERKKWIHCFENVTAVIYVASLSAYDELMFEDDRKNVMLDSLELFEEICDNQWFVTTPIILFLNKNDLFIKKIRTIPLTVCFPTFEQETQKSANDYEACAAYISAKYERLNKNVKRQLHIHVTTATDKTNVFHVFSDVQQSIVEQGLQRNNLI